MIPIYCTSFFKLAFRVQNVSLDLEEAVLRVLLLKVASETLKELVEGAEDKYQRLNYVGLVECSNEIACLCSMSGPDFDYLRVCCGDEEDDPEEVPGDVVAENQGAAAESEEEPEKDSVEEIAIGVLQYYVNQDPVLHPHKQLIEACFAVEDVKNAFRY